MKKCKRLTKENGWGLVETLLTLGTISALSVGIYMAFSPTDATAKTKAEQENIHLMSQNIINAFGLINNYSQVSNSTIIGDNLVPSSLRNGNDIISSWGENINITPYQVQSPNDAFIINYTKTPKEICSRLAAASQSGAYDVLVNGTSVLSSQGKLNPISVSRLCQDGSELSFVFTGFGNRSYAADPLDLPPPPTSVTPDLDTPITNVVDNPDDVDDANVAPPVTTTPTTPPVVVTPPPVTPSSPPPTTTIPPITPPVIPPTIPVVTPCSPLASQYQSVNTCPSGMYGQYQQQRNYSCPEAWEAPVAGSWFNVSNTCTNCPSPTTNVETQWISSSAACPTGQTGSNTWETEQNQTRTMSYNCPANTPSLPAPSYTAWSAWSNTGNTRNVVNTCKSKGGCSFLVDYSSNTYDTSDAFFSISYTLNGVAGGCSSSLRNDGQTGFDNCREGANGVITMGQWEDQARIGDTWEYSGSTSGWGSGRHEPWGSDTTKFAMMACDTPYIISRTWGSGNSAPYECHGEPDTPEAAAAAICGPKGTRKGYRDSIEWCETSASHTYHGYGDVECQ